MLIKSGGKNKGQWTFILTTKHSLYPTECLEFCSTTPVLKAFAIRKSKDTWLRVYPEGIERVLGVHWKEVTRGDEKTELEAPEDKLR